MAKILNVHSNTIYRGIKCGRINAFRIGVGKKAMFRISDDEIQRIAEFDAMELIEKIIKNRSLS